MTALCSRWLYNLSSCSSSLSWFLRTHNHIRLLQTIILHCGLFIRYYFSHILLCFAIIVRYYCSTFYYLSHPSAALLLAPVSAPTGLFCLCFWDWVPGCINTNDNVCFFTWANVFPHLFHLSQFKPGNAPSTSTSIVIVMFTSVSISICSALCLLCLLLLLSWFFLLLLLYYYYYVHKHSKL